MSNKYAVATDFFPASNRASREQLWRLIDSVASHARATAPPAWILGDWALNGAEWTDRVQVTLDGIRSVWPEFKASPEFGTFDYDYSTSPGGQLAIDGPRGASCGGFLAGGEIKILTSHTASNGERVVDSWVFRNRSINYGFGRSEGPIETWTFTRITP